MTGKNEGKLMFRLHLLHNERAAIIRMTICLAFIVCILMSYNLWLSERFFPLIPFFNKFITVRHPLDWIGLVALITTLIFGTITPIRKVFLPLFLLLAFLLLQDQMRWQPWVYLYSLILLPFLRKNTKETSHEYIHYVSLILIGVYVWSGIQKFNPNFIDNTFRDIMSRILRTDDPFVLKNIRILGYAIPVIEILIGLGLAFPRLRNKAVILAIITHIFILLYLSPIGINDNYIAYPWNIAMAIVVATVFYKNPQIRIFRQEMKAEIFILNSLPIVMIWILPMLNMINKWDHYLSFSLYSDNINAYYIAIEENEIKKLVGKYDSYYVKFDGMSGGQIIDVNKWSMGELNVPFYPERRIFKKLAKTFCNLQIPNEKLIFIELEKPFRKKILHTVNCNDLR